MYHMYNLLWEIDQAEVDIRETHVPGILQQTAIKLPKTDPKASFQWDDMFCNRCSICIHM